MTLMKLGASVTALCLIGAPIAQARAVSSACASASEISAIQVSAVIQELTDAALTCGPETMAKMSRFQIVFQSFGVFFSEHHRLKSVDDFSSALYSLSHNGL